MRSHEDAAEQATGDQEDPPAVSRTQLCAWLERVGAARDKAAFEHLFNYFGPRLHGYMRRTGSDPTQAEELVQETMVDVWTKAHQYRSALGAPSTWVFSIARNLRVDRLRKDHRRDELPALPLHDDLPSNQLSDEVRVDALQLMNRLQSLPREQAAILELVYLDGLSQSEISDRLRVPLGTVKSRIRLAFTSIRRTLRNPS